MRCGGRYVPDHTTPHICVGRVLACGWAGIFLLSHPSHMFLFGDFWFNEELTLRWIIAAAAAAAARWVGGRVMGRWLTVDGTVIGESKDISVDTLLHWFFVYALCACLPALYEYGSGRDLYGFSVYRCNECVGGWVVNCIWMDEIVILGGLMGMHST